MDKNIAFLAYNLTRRSKVLAEHLRAQIITAKVSPSLIIRLLNYPFLLFLTFLNLVSKNFDLVFVQLPPVHTAIPAYLYCKLFHKQLIFDTHSGIFLNRGLHQKLYLKIYCAMIKHIDLNIVHNDAILKQNCLENSKSVILEDKIQFSPTEFKQNPSLIITVICGYGRDEPMPEIIKTCQALPDINFFLTGHSNKLKKKTLPSNIHLTGYLSDIEYEQLLKNSSLIMVLTTRFDTVLCGAYEAVGLTKPLIISDTPTLRKYFSKGVIYTANNTKAIVQSIKTAQQELARLYSEIVLLRQEKTETWQKQFEPIQKVLESK